MLDPTLFSHQSALYVATHVSGMAPLVYLLSSWDLWELRVASMLLCCKGTARGNVTFYSTLYW